jgi:hypothetical protein
LEWCTDSLLPYNKLFLHYIQLLKVCITTCSSKILWFSTCVLKRFDIWKIKVASTSSLVQDEHISYKSCHILSTILSCSDENKTKISGLQLCIFLDIKGSPIDFHLKTCQHFNIIGFFFFQMWLNYLTKV